MPVVAGGLGIAAALVHPVGNLPVFEIANRLKSFLGGAAGFRLLLLKVESAHDSDKRRQQQRQGDKAPDGPAARPVNPDGGEEEIQRPNIGARQQQHAQPHKKNHLGGLRGHQPADGAAVKQLDLHHIAQDHHQTNQQARQRQKRGRLPPPPAGRARGKHQQQGQAIQQQGQG